MDNETKYNETIQLRTKIGWSWHASNYIILDIVEWTTLNSAYNEKKCAEIFLCYWQLFIKGDIFIGEWEIFGAEVFHHYSWFFVKGNFIIDGVKCSLIFT